MTNLDAEQDLNTAKLVMHSFYKVAKDEGITADDITRYLQEKFGDVWHVNTLSSKAEDTLQRSAALGFLQRNGDRYVAAIAREVCFGFGRRRRCRCGRKRRRPRRTSCRRRRRRSRRRRSCKCRR